MNDVLAYLFDEQPHVLAPPLAAWLTSSRRFAAFVTTFRDKIRKKVRAAHTGESLLDLQLELETAYFLLQERSLNVIYEPQPRGPVRCPDFAVTYTTSLTFMVEVTRLRPLPASRPVQAQIQAPPPADPVARLTDTVCHKLGQLVAHRSNVLLVAVEAAGLTQSDLQAAMLRVQQRAERNDTTLFQRHGIHDRSDFFHHYHRLSEVVVRGAHIAADEPVVIWVNRQAKHPLPSKVRTVLYRSHGA